MYMRAYDSGERCRLISLSLSVSIYLSLSNLSYILVRRCSLSPPPCPSNVYRLVYLSNLTIKELCWGCTHGCDAKSGGLFFSPPFPEKRKLPHCSRCRALRNISFSRRNIPLLIPILLHCHPLRSRDREILKVAPSEGRSPLAIDAR